MALRRLLRAICNKAQTHRSECLCTMRSRAPPPGARSPLVDRTTARLVRDKGSMRSTGGGNGRPAGVSASTLHGSGCLSLRLGCARVTPCYLLPACCERTPWETCRQCEPQPRAWILCKYFTCYFPPPALPVLWADQGLSFRNACGKAEASDGQRTVKSGLAPSAVQLPPHRSVDCSSHRSACSTATSSTAPAQANAAAFAAPPAASPAVAAAAPAAAPSC